MKRQWFASGVFWAVLTLLATTAPASAWVSFQSEAGGFQISFPEQPVESTSEDVDADGKALNQTRFQVQFDDGVMFVSIQDNLELADAQGPELDQALQRGVEALKRVTGGEVRVNEKLTLHEQFPGWAFAADIRGLDGHLRSRMYLVNGRLYQVMVVGTPTFANSQDANRFLDSFALLSDAQ